MSNQKYTARIYFKTTPKKFFGPGRKAQQVSDKAKFVELALQGKKVVYVLSTSCREGLARALVNTYRSFHFRPKLPLIAPNKLKLNIPHTFAEDRLVDTTGPLGKTIKRKRRRVFFYKSPEKNNRPPMLYLTITHNTDKLNEKQAKYFDLILRRWYSNLDYEPEGWLTLLDESTIQMIGYCLPPARISALLWTWRFQKKHLEKVKFVKEYPIMAAEDSLLNNYKSGDSGFWMGWYFWNYLKYSRDKRIITTFIPKTPEGNGAMSFGMNNFNIKDLTRWWRYFFTFKKTIEVLHKKYNTIQPKEGTVPSALQHSFSRNPSISLLPKAIMELYLVAHKIDVDEFEKRLFDGKDGGV
jgi:hypothetical protein